MASTMLLEIIHSCPDISKGAASPATPVYYGCPRQWFLGGLSSWIPPMPPPGSHLPLDRSSWVAGGVRFLVQIMSPGATGQETPPQLLTAKC